MGIRRWRDIESHVPIGHQQGLAHESYINCDALVLVPRAELVEPIGTLDDTATLALNAALRFALGLQDAS